MINALSGGAFALLFLALIARWIAPLARHWHLFLVGSLLLGWAAGVLQLSGLVAPILLLALVYAKSHSSRRYEQLQVLADTIIIVLCLALALHVVPGVNNILVIDNAVIKSHSLPYSLWFNYDKALAGLFTVVAFVEVSNVRDAAKSIAGWTTAGLGCTIFFVLLPGLMLGGIAFDPGVPDEIAAWLVSNLFVTSVAEEAFFRGFVQHRLERRLTNWNGSYGALAAVFAAAFVFGMAHAAGGWVLVVAAFLAGLIYGLVYLKTRRIEASIFTHFLTNAVHMFFFSYPMLA